MFNCKICKITRKKNSNVFKFHGENYSRKLKYHQSRKTNLLDYIKLGHTKFQKNLLSLIKECYTDPNLILQSTDIFQNVVYELKEKVTLNAR